MTLNESIKKGIDQLFKNSAQESEVDFLSALVPHSDELIKGKKVLPIGFAHEMNELCAFSSGYAKYLNLDDTDIIFQTRNMILIYTHILESDFIYLVLLNLLLIIKKKKCSWSFYKFDSFGEIIQKKKKKYFVNILVRKLK